MSDIEVSLNALRLDELIDELKKSDSSYSLADLLNNGYDKYKKDFFNKLKEVLKERKVLPKDNKDIILNFFILKASY